MMCKVLILALAIMAVAARPQHGGKTGSFNLPPTKDIDGVTYPELPLDGSDCEIGVTYHHFGNLCECKPEHEVSCKRIKQN